MAKIAEAHKKWALVGAETRLKEVQAEIAEIYRVFPELRGRVGRAAAGDKQMTRQFSPKGKVSATI